MERSHVVLAAAVERALAAAARSALPREMIAVLGGERSFATFRVGAVDVLPNSARGLDRFAVDGAAFARGERRLRDAGQPFVGFAHSHPGGAAALSRLDREQLWHDCLQLVLAVPAHGPVAFGAFVLGASGAVPLPLAVARDGLAAEVPR